MDFERRMHTMKKTYRIEVDCANCANLMEEAPTGPRASKRPW